MILYYLTPFGRHQLHGFHAAWWVSILLSLLLTATPLLAQTAASLAWGRDLYNPNPRPDDVLLPLPCGGAMTFRWVQAEGRAPAGIAPGLTSLFRLVGPFEHEGRHDLLVGKYEVSRLQYATLPALTGGPCPRVDAAGRQVQGGIGWYDALGFAARWSRWLARQAPSLPDCTRTATRCIPRSAGRPVLLRLPTEAEWEYVARGGLAVTPGEFGQPLYPMADGLEHHAWYERNSDQQLKPIGLRAANPLGLYDLYGNVEELTLGLYRNAAYPGQLGAGVIRGGSVHTGRGGIDAGERNESPLYGRGVTNRAPDNGLRLIADVTAPPDGTLTNATPLSAPPAVTGLRQVKVDAPAPAIPPSSSAPGVAPTRWFGWQTGLGGAALIAGLVAWGIRRRQAQVRHARIIRRLARVLLKIRRARGDIEALSDASIWAKTQEFRARFAAGENLDSLLPEVFAVVCEAGQRVLGMGHFDLQLIGGLVLHQGKIAEIKDGEGKTLVATLAAYLNALPGKGVHIVTLNDDLARHDSAWMGPLYHALGLSVGVINSSPSLEVDAASYLYDPDYAPTDDQGYPSLRPVTRWETYAADITYGTGSEFGFDYLRDNMAFVPESRNQRDLYYAIVDEVDAILIDEAGTPLIISGLPEDSTDLYRKIDAIIPRLTRQDPMTNDQGKPDFGPGDYSVDENCHQVFLSEDGHQHVEEMLVEIGVLAEGDGLYDPGNIVLMHHVYAALRAHALFQKNLEYVVRDGQIIIIDKLTGHTMPGRRWPDGLHQAVEAKERVAIQPQNQTLAAISYHQLFRLYPKLAGMTGTAETDADEFREFYGLEVVVIPTNRPMVRRDHGDLVYLTQAEKYRAVVEDVRDCVTRGQPVLVGTASGETAELLSKLLVGEKIPYQLLNTMQQGREAGIIARAGRPGAVTIATNIVGRGMEIALGGNLEAELEQAGPGADHAAIRAAWKERYVAVMAAGGLHVVGTERHESRRLDNQLRGCAGRQGDPGSSRFYLSLEDNLMRIFASERVAAMMQQLGMQAGEAIEHPWVTKAIANAQRKIECRTFENRKQLLEYGDIVNDQRQVIYRQRRELMDTDDISDTVNAMLADILERTIDAYIPANPEEQWDLECALTDTFGGDWPIRHWLAVDRNLRRETLRARIANTLTARHADKGAQVGTETLRQLEKAVMLQALDTHWKDHLAAMDYLRQGIRLRGYGQKNPKQEYKREAFEMFSAMLEDIKQEVVGTLCKLQVQAVETVPESLPPAPPARDFQFQHEEFRGFGVADDAAAALPDGAAVAQEPDQAFARGAEKVSRNDPCPCGSGKKYKQCHGRAS